MVAEGIESKEQSEKLRQMGCDYGQGYLFSRPVQVADAAAYMLNEKVRAARISGVDAEAQAPATSTQRPKTQ